MKNARPCENPNHQDDQRKPVNSPPFSVGHQSIKSSLTIWQDRQNMEWNGLTKPQRACPHLIRRRETYIARGNYENAGPTTTWKRGNALRSGIESATSGFCSLHVAVRRRFDYSPLRAFLPLFPPQYLALRHFVPLLT